MIFNDSVSIIDKAVDDDGVERLIQYVLSGVYFEESKGIIQDADGQNRNYNATLFIPKSYICSEKYISSKSWEKLTFTEKLNYFRLAPSQFIINNSSTLEYDSLNDLINNEESAYEVISIEVYNKVLPHFELICK